MTLTLKPGLVTPYCEQKLGMHKEPTIAGMRATKGEGCLEQAGDGEKHPSIP